MPKSKSRSRGRCPGGSQPSGPSANDVQPVPRYLYRTTKANYRDLIWVEPSRTPDWQVPIGDLHRDHDFMRHIVIHCISFGSDAGVTSALLPSCRSLAAGMAWYRRSAASHRNNCSFLVRIDTAMVGEENTVSYTHLRAHET